MRIEEQTEQGDAAEYDIRSREKREVEDEGGAERKIRRSRVKEEEQRD